MHYLILLCAFLMCSSTSYSMDDDADNAHYNMFLGSLSAILTNPSAAFPANLDNEIENLSPLTSKRELPITNLIDTNQFFMFNDDDNDDDSDSDDNTSNRDVAKPTTNLCDAPDKNPLPVDLDKQKTLPAPTLGKTIARSTDIAPPAKKIKIILPQPAAQDTNNDDDQDIEEKTIVQKSASSQLSPPVGVAFATHTMQPTRSTIRNKQTKLLQALTTLQPQSRQPAISKGRTKTCTECNITYQKYHGLQYHMLTQHRIFLESGPQWEQYAKTYFKKIQEKDEAHQHTASDEKALTHEDDDDYNVMQESSDKGNESDQDINDNVTKERTTRNVSHPQLLPKIAALKIVMENNEEIVLQNNGDPYPCPGCKNTFYISDLIKHLQKLPATNNNASKSHNPQKD